MAMMLTMASCSKSDKSSKTNDATSAATENTQAKSAASNSNYTGIPDFTLSTPEGTPLSIMSEVSKNKITILDFWASWCQPCMREMPFMKELYAKYHSKGLGIVGISLDTEREAWQQAISRLGIEWPQVSDLLGWDSKPAREFEVNSIPHIIIVDYSGDIIEIGLRGEELQKFISGLLDS